MTGEKNSGDGKEFAAHEHRESPNPMRDAPAVGIALTRAYGQRAVLALNHMDALMARLERFVSFGRKWYESDPEDGVPRMACELLAIKAGEAATRIPAEMREEYPDVAWVNLSDLRNFLTHQYDSTDFNVLWDTISNDFPAEHLKIRQILGPKA